jgi:hypothetical protein
MEHTSCQQHPSHRSFHLFHQSWKKIERGSTGRRVCESNDNSEQNRLWKHTDGKVVRFVDRGDELGKMLATIKALLIALQLGGRHYTSWRGKAKESIRNKFRAPKGAKKRERADGENDDDDVGGKGASPSFIDLVIFAMFLRLPMRFKTGMHSDPGRRVST